MRVFAGSGRHGKGTDYPCNDLKAEKKTSFLASQIFPATASEDDLPGLGRSTEKVASASERNLPSTVSLI